MIISDFIIEASWQSLDNTPQLFEVLCYNDFTIMPDDFIEPVEEINTMSKTIGSVMTMGIYMKVGIIFMSFLFLIACSSEKVTYQNDFPKQDSPGLSKFLQTKLVSSQYDFLLKQQDKLIYNDHVTGKHLNYYELDEEKLSDSYQPIFDSNTPGEMFDELANTSMLTELQEANDYGLPAIELQVKNQLFIKTEHAEKTFDLVEVLQDFALSPADRLSYSLYRVNPDHFILRMENRDKNEQDYVMLFIKQDLSKVVAISEDFKSINENLRNGSLNDFTHLFSNNLDEQRFEKAFQMGKRFFIFDCEENQLKEIGKDDYLSDDGKFVYLNGNKDPISDGEQRIQTLENYLDGKDKDEKTFDISFKKIAKELNFKSAKDVGIAKIVHFDKNFIVLMLQYKAPVTGTAGTTNVMIDLQQEGEPTAYLVDLGLQF